MKINTTKNIHHTPQYILVYGPSGIGKTTLATTLAGPTLILDAESGLSVLQGKDIEYVSLSQNEDGSLVPETDRFRRLQEFMNFIQTDEAKKKYKYIFVDSLTEVSQNIFKHMKEKHGDGFKLWGEYTNAMFDFIKFFRDLRAYTVVFVSLEDRVDEDEGGGYYCPNVGGRKVKEFLLPAFDEVFRMIVNKDKARQLVCKPTAKTQAKDRSGKLSDIEHPDLGAVLTKIRGE